VIPWRDDDEGSEKSRRIPTSTIRQVQRIAQEMGVLGSGLQGEDVGTRGTRSHYWDDDFFPQLLELKWPPEGRFVERDCTCDFWERIRCECCSQEKWRQLRLHGIQFLCSNVLVPLSVLFLTLKIAIDGASRRQPDWATLFTNDLLLYKVIFTIYASDIDNVLRPSSFIRGEELV
jgi:hypothetical protein